MENLFFQDIFKLVHRKVGLKIIALERSYFWHTLLLFFHDYFSLPALAQKYTSYCAYFPLFVLPVYALFPVQYFKLIFSEEALQVPWDGSHVGVVDLSRRFGLWGAVRTHTNVCPSFTPSGFKMLEWQERVSGRRCWQFSG